MVADGLGASANILGNSPPVSVVTRFDTTAPRVITVDKNAAYPPAFAALQQKRMLSEVCLLRQCKYLNNLVERIIGF